MEPTEAQDNARTPGADEAGPAPSERTLSARTLIAVMVVVAVAIVVTILLVVPNGGTVVG